MLMRIIMEPQAKALAVEVRFLVPNFYVPIHHQHLSLTIPI